MSAVAERVQSIVDADHAVALEAVAAGKMLVNIYQRSGQQIELFDIADHYRYAGVVTKRDTLRRTHEQFPDQLVIHADDLQALQHDAQMLGAGYKLDAPINPHNAMWTDVLNGDTQAAFLQNTKSAVLERQSNGMYTTDQETVQGLLRDNYLEGTYYRDHSKGYDMELIDTEATDTIDERGEI